MKNQKEGGGRRKKQKSYLDEEAEGKGTCMDLVQTHLH